MTALESKKSIQDAFMKAFPSLIEAGEKSAVIGVSLAAAALVASLQIEPGSAPVVSAESGTRTTFLLAFLGAFASGIQSLVCWFRARRAFQNAKAAKAPMAILSAQLDASTGTAWIPYLAMGLNAVLTFSAGSRLLGYEGGFWFSVLSLVSMREFYLLQKPQDHSWREAVGAEPYASDSVQVGRWIRSLWTRQAKVTSVESEPSSSVPSDEA